MIFLALGLGVALGAGAMSYWRDAVRDIVSLRDEATIGEQALEIKRLRAQVADIIGKEK